MFYPFYIIKELIQDSKKYSKDIESKDTNQIIKKRESELKDRNRNKRN